MWIHGDRNGLGKDREDSGSLAGLEIGKEEGWDSVIESGRVL